MNMSLSCFRALTLSGLGTVRCERDTLRVTVTIHTGNEQISSKSPSVWRRTFLRRTFADSVGIHKWLMFIYCEDPQLEYEKAEMIEMRNVHSRRYESKHE